MCSDLVIIRQTPYLSVLFETPAVPCQKAAQVCKPGQLFIGNVAPTDIWAERHSQQKATEQGLFSL